MIILESIWKPNRTDVLAGLNQRRWFLNTGTTQNAATVGSSNFGTVPANTVRVVVGVSLQITPTAGVSALRGTVRASNNINQVLGEFGINDAPAAGNPIVRSGVVFWIMGPGDRLVQTAGFSAAGVVNSIDSTIWGYELPRGNIEL